MLPRRSIARACVFRQRRHHGPRGHFLEDLSLADPGFKHHWGEQSALSHLSANALIYKSGMESALGGHLLKMRETPSSRESRGARVEHPEGTRFGQVPSLHIRGGCASARNRRGSHHATGWTNVLRRMRLESILSYRGRMKDVLTLHTGYFDSGAPAICETVVCEPMRLSPQRVGGRLHRRGCACSPNGPAGTSRVQFRGFYSWPRAWHSRPAPRV